MRDLAGVGSDTCACMPDAVLRRAMACCLTWTLRLSPKSASFVMNLPLTAVAPASMQTVHIQ